MRGTVTKKRDRWYICYYIGKDGNGKWVQKWEGSWDTKREAERVLRSRIDEQENTFQHKAENATVAAFLRHWLAEVCQPRLAANTVNGYRVNIKSTSSPISAKFPSTACSRRTFSGFTPRWPPKGFPAQASAMSITICTAPSIMP